MIMCYTIYVKIGDKGVKCGYRKAKTDKMVNENV